MNRLLAGGLFVLLLLATVAHKYRFERVSDAPVQPFPTITLRPRGGVSQRVVSRLPVPA